MEKEKMKYGYFDDVNREYVIDRADTPMPWSNYIGSAEFGGVVTNNAAGYAFYKSVAQGRLTRYRFNSLPADLCGRYVYFHDADDSWSNSWAPTMKELQSYECRHGSGYTIIKSKRNDITSEVKYFVPLNKCYEIWQVTVTNDSSEIRSLSAFPFLEPQCNWSAEDDNNNLQYNQYISKTEYSDGVIDIGSNVNMPTDVENFTNKDQARHTFFALHGADAAGYDSDLKKFLGTYGSYAMPQVVAGGKCGDSSCSGDMPCAAFQVDLNLAPSESKTFFITYGLEVVSVDQAFADEAFAAVKAYWHGRLNSLHAETPDKDFNSMINMWAPYNNLMTFYWSRAASLVYAGERDGLGYRDTVQDIVGAAALVTEEAKKCLELMITGQYASGGAKSIVKPFDHKPGHEVPDGIYRSDDCMWLFNAVPEYIKETGKFDFYNKVLPYAVKGEATVFEHLKRAIEFNLERSGNHGLPCGLHADWNDCIRLGETGETVFVAFQLRLALREYIEIAERLENSEQIEWATKKLAALDDNLMKFAWDGEWYLRAYRDDGLKFGSKENDEGFIFMNPQSWAVLSGHAKGEYAEKCMKSLDKNLATDYGVMVCTSPYITTDPQICLGRLMNPGMKENGSIFNHTQGWGVMAQAELGNSEKAWQYLKAVLPSSFNEMAEVREVEPYAVCQITHSSFSPRFGTGRVSWLSGSAVWNYYAMTHAILGIKPHYDGLEISPCVPAEWDGFSVQREFRGKKFDITVKRGDVVGLVVNGNAVDGNVIPAEMFEQNNVVQLIIKN
jgi:N,N'-diacetylchitobiose phosphorylase